MRVCITTAQPPRVRRYRSETDCCIILHVQPTDHLSKRVCERWSVSVPTAGTPATGQTQRNRLLPDGPPQSGAGIPRPPERSVGGEGRSWHSVGPGAGRDIGAAGGAQLPGPVSGRYDAPLVVEPAGVPAVRTEQHRLRRNSAISGASGRIHFSFRNMNQRRKYLSIGSRTSTKSVTHHDIPT